MMNIETAQFVRFLAVMFIGGFLTGGMPLLGAVLIGAATVVALLAHGEVEKRIYYAR